MSPPRVGCSLVLLLLQAALLLLLLLLLLLDSRLLANPRWRWRLLGLLSSLGDKLRL